MRKATCILCLIIAVWLVGCKNGNDNFNNQIQADLLGMLHNKVEVEKIFVKRVTSNANGEQEVIFDCQLHFIDDLYKEDGALAFKKGLIVKETSNVFKYSTNGDSKKLVGFEFGDTQVISQ